MQKVNSFFGYEAISKIKILQNNNPENFLNKKNVYDKPKKILVSENETTYINEELDGIEDERLRSRLEKLGHAVLNEIKK